VSWAKVFLPTVVLRVALLPAILVFAAPAWPQRSPLPSVPTAQPGERLNALGLLPRTITVNVREANGMPLEGHAFVKLSSQSRHYSATVAVQDNSVATFDDVTGGDYDVEVNCAGYKTAVEHVSFQGGSGVALFVYLHSETEAAATAARPPGMKLTPKLQQELDKAFEKMRKRQYDGAREHFEKAAKLAPANPDMPYMLGMIEYNQQHLTWRASSFRKR